MPVSWMQRPGQRSHTVKHSALHRNGALRKVSGVRHLRTGVQFCGSGGVVRPAAKLVVRGLRWAAGRTRSSGRVWGTNASCRELSVRMGARVGAREVVLVFPRRIYRNPHPGRTVTLE